MAIDAVPTTFPDEEHSRFEPRFVTAGMSRRGRILVVLHTQYDNLIRSSAPGAKRVTKEGSMKKANRRSANDMLPEYDFASMKGGVRGKYTAQYRAGTNLVLLGPEVADAFPTDAAVNQALPAVLSMTKVVRLPNQASHRTRPKTARR